MRQHYRVEPTKNKEQVSFLEAQAAKGAVTLLYGAKDEKHNNALVLCAFVSSKG